MRLLLLLLMAAASARPATYFLTITGLGGEPDYDQRFAMWAKEMEKVLKDAGGGARVETLVAPRREQIEARLASIAREASADDALVVVLIGHGTYDGYEYKFNLPGPDLAASSLAKLLDGVKATRQLIVNATSASGGSIAALRRRDRIVVSATRTGTEKNATVFARYWIEALRDPAADTDKNETVSALEAFRYAERKTASFYETEKRLATEHPVLEDTGKGEGVKEPAADNGEGLLAGAFPLIRMGKNAEAYRDPAKLKLLAKKEDLEQKIDRLKYQKAATPPAEYKKSLAALLLDLARTQEELEK
jgi:hypothetical protein